ncbi:MAG: hypothetical protein KF746_04385 [Chitinophagaceae bacterium]|nr:hypothetical protein [Chitinophagaceae bacterium]
MKNKINSRQDYHETMAAVYKLMDKGEANLFAAEQKKSQQCLLQRRNMKTKC